MPTPRDQLIAAEAEYEHARREFRAALTRYTGAYWRLEELRDEIGEARDGD